MPRLAILRAGYACLGLAFGMIAASAFVGSLFLLGLPLALAGGILLVFSRDVLPKYAGLTLLGYFLLSVLAFLVATPVTINKGGRFFVNGAPPELAASIVQYLLLAAPLMLVATMLLAAWEREWAVRLLLWGALGGFVIHGLLTVFLTPTGIDAARSQGELLRNLLVVSALAGAVGATWAASRPESYA